MGKLINANKNYSITHTKFEAHMSQMVCATKQDQFFVRWSIKNAPKGTDCKHTQKVCLGQSGGWVLTDLNVLFI